MEYLDFELPIKDLEEQLQKCILIGEESDVDVSVTCLNLQKKLDKTRANIYKNLTDIISEHKPQVLILEKIYSHYKYPATSILMGHARGVVCLACGENGVQLFSYAATRIKKAVTGNGRAGKHQVQSMVKSLLKLNTAPEPFDVSDALAMAISYVYIEGVEETK